MKPRKSRFCSKSAVGLVFISFVLNASAAVVTWDGGGTGGTALETLVNWSTNALPSISTPDTATWNGTVAGNLSLTYSSGLGGASGNLGLNLNLTSAQTGSVSIDSSTNTAIRLNNVTLDSGSGAFSLGNGTGSGATAFAITLGGATNQTHTWTNNSTNAATVSSDVVFGLGGAGNHALLFSGTGIWNVSSALSPSNSAGLSIQKTGTGTLNLSGGGNWNNASGFGTVVTAFGGSFGAVFKQGVTNITSGTYTMNSSELVVGGADVTGTNTQLNLSNSGSITGVSWLSIGRGNGTGTVSSDLTLNNSSSISAANMSGGFNASVASSPKGTVTLNDTSSITATTTVNIAESNNSNITINLNGTSTFTQNTTGSGQTKVGMGSGSTGVINVAGGTGNFERDLIIGAGGTGQLNISSGAVNVATATERWLKLGDAAGASGGTIVITGGNLNLNTSSDIRYSTTAANTGTNTVTISGGTISGYVGNKTGGFSATSVIDLNYSATGAVNNTFNLDGGTVNIGQVITNNNAGTAAFNFNGGALKAAAASANFVDLGGSSQKVYVKNGGAIVDSNGFNITIVDQLQNGGSGGLNKQGAGTLSLSNNALYVGATAVSQGTLNVAGLSATSGVSVAAGATIQGTGTIGGTTSLNGTGATVANTSSVTQLSLGGLTSTASGGIIGLTLNGTAAGIAVTGNLATGGHSTSINAYNSNWTNGTNNLIGFGTFTGSVGDYAFNPSGLSGRQIASALFSTGSSIAVTISGDVPTWSGAGGGTWTTVSSGDNSGSNSWALLTGKTATNFWASDAIQFNDTYDLGAGPVAVTQGSVNIAGSNVSPVSTVFNNSSVNYTIGSTGGFGIAGGYLTKNGTGTTTLTTTNTYTGVTTISAGTLQIGDGTTDGSISSSSNIVNNGSLVYNLAGSQSYANAISGTGSVTKSGAGSIALGGANTFSGGLTINGGTVEAPANTSLGDNAGAITINGGTLKTTATAAQTITHPITVGAGGGTINIAGTAVASQNSRLIFGAANILNGSGALTVSGTGTLQQAGGQGALVINSSNSYSGILTVTDGGMVEINNNDAIANAGSYVMGNNSGLTVVNGITADNAITVNGTGAVIAFNNGNAGVYSGAITLNNGVTFGLRDWYNYATARNGTVSGVISGSSGISVNRGTATSGGVLTLSGANTYSGATTVNAGIIKAGIATAAGVSGAFGVNSAVTLGNAASTGIDITGFDTQIGSLAGGGTTGGTVTLGAATLTTGANNNSTTYSGAIGGTGNLVKIGTGTQTLSGYSTFTGNITVNGGVLEAALSNNVDNPTSGSLGNNQTSAQQITINNGGTLKLSAGDVMGSAVTDVKTSITINGGGTLTNNGVVFNRLGSVNLVGDSNGGAVLSTIGGAVAGYQSYSFDADAVVTVSGTAASSITGSGAFSGIHLNSNTVFNVGDVTGSSASDLVVSASLINRNSSEGGSAGGLTKTGAGTMEISGTSTYTGATTVNAGKLVVNGNISTSVTTVSGSGTLGGSGTVGALVATSGGIVAPGNSPGILNAGDTDLQSGSTLAIEINGDTVGTGYDQLNVTGTVALAGTLDLSLGYTPVENTMFFIVNNDGTDAVTGTFSGLADNAWFQDGSQWFKIGYSGDAGTNSFTGGNDVVLMAVPEPGAALLGGLGVLALLRRRRVS